MVKMLIWVIVWHFVLIPGNVRPVESKLLLNEKEILLNNLLGQLKSKALGDISEHSNQSFEHYKKTIEVSKLFKMIKKMPKGASLDGHLFGLVSHEYLFNLTRAPDLYILFKDDAVKFAYKPKSDEWKHVRTLVKNGTISETFLKESLSLQSYDFQDPLVYSRKLNDVFNTIRSLLSKVSVLKSAIYQMLHEHYEDNVMYIEFRYSLNFYDSKTGRKFQPHEMLKICNRIIKKFRQFHTNFIDAKIIFSPHSYRNFDENFATLMHMIELYPKLLVGFDVKPDKNTTRILDEIKKIPASVQVFLYFQQVVTFRPNTRMDLIHAMINKPSRYIYNNNLLSNDMFYKHVKRLGVAINICPLSLVRDNLLKLRSDTAARYIDEGYHVITFNEYSGLWDARGLSYDWYLLYVFMGKQNVDLSFLKEMATNSLIYSGLSAIDTNVAISMWTELWNQFVQEAQTFKSKGYKTK